MTARPRTFLSLPSPLRLLVALIAMVAGIASGATLGGAETAVAANNIETAAAVEADANIPAGHVGSEPAAFDDWTSGCCVAPNTPGAASGPLRDPATGRFTASPGRVDSPRSPSTHGNSLSSERPTTLYQLTDAETGAHLKWGITSESNPASRYTQAQLAGKDFNIMQVGSRADMAAVERQLVERLPGSMNHEPWAGAQLGNFRWIP